MTTCRRFGAWIFLVVCMLVSHGPAATAGPFAEARDPRADETLERLRVALDARKRGCPQESLHGAPLPALFCVVVPRSARKDLAALETRIDEVFSDAGARAGAEWTRDPDGLERRSYGLPGAEITLTLDRRSGRLVAHYPARFPSCLESGLPLWSEGVEGWAPPVRERGAAPEFPEEARKHHLSGLLQLEVEVLENGRVGDACVQYVNVEGVGFEQAALEAVRRWSYSPSTRDGHAVGVRMLVSVEFMLF